MTGKASAARSKKAATRPGRAPTAAARADAPRAARDREATKARLLGAVGIVLARDGFAALGVNAVAKEAGVDKVLLYRYFGGLPELLREWGASGRFWPSVAELVGARPEEFFALPAAERYARFFDHFIDALRARPLTIEILAAEIAERNELAAILESEREAWGAEASRLLAARRIRAPAGAAGPHLAAHRRRAVPARPKPQHPRLRRRRHPQRGRLGESEDGGARNGAGAGPLSAGWRSRRRRAS